MHELELREERHLAERFVERVASLPRVLQIWAEYEPSLDVTVVVAERDLESELRFYAIFRELASQTSRASLGDLAVLPAPFEPDHAELLFSA